MKHSTEFWSNLANDLLDVLFDSFGARWCITWALDNGYTDEEILEIFVDDKELLAEVKKESEVE